MFITADNIHDGTHFLPQGTVIELSDNGTIIAIHEAGLTPYASSLTPQYYAGILSPGFVNAHCHMELSHMKGAIPEGLSLIPFLKHIPLHRNDYTQEQKDGARINGYNELLANGVVAVGDICNTNDTLDVRALGKMHVHSFVESMGFTQTPDRQFAYATQVYDTFAAQQAGDKRLSQSIVPHAPYSVSEQLFRLIDQHNPNSLISIHNQESFAEDEYYLMKKGAVIELLQTLGIDDTFFQPSGKSSLQTYLQWFSSAHPFMFIHNTYTSRVDIEVAKTLLPNLYWCFCPNANIYIESRLPDIDMFIREKVNICVGTDSLASNHQLSVLAELATIKHHYPHISWETLLTWGTSNGAKALQMDNMVGSLKVGTKPGILHLSNLDTQPTVTRII